MGRFKLPVDHPWVAVDFDGTLCEDGYWPKIGPPREGAQEFCRYLRHDLGLRIMIFTARTNPVDITGRYLNVQREIKKIEAWMWENRIEYDYIWPSPKPVFVVAFVDDRAFNADNLSRVLKEMELKWGKDLRKDWTKTILPKKKKSANRKRTKSAK